MNFRFRLISVMLIIFMVIGIYYIGVQNNIVAQDDQSNTYYRTENVYLWYSDDKLTDFFTSAAVAFHEENEDVRVIPKLVTADEYLEYISAASVEGEDFPDLYLVTNDSLEKAYLSGLASEVKDSKKVLNTNHFSQVALNASTYQGKIVGYPLYFETSVLVYNKTYLKQWLDKVKEEGLEKEDDEVLEEELDETSNVTDEVEKEDYEGFDVENLTLEDLIPETIDDIKKFADEYEAPDGVDAVFKWDVSDIFYNYFFVGNYMIVGGECGDDEMQLNVYGNDTIECMNVYQHLNQFFSIDAATSSYDGMIEDFIDGKFVFSIATSDVITRLAKAEDEAKEQFETEKVKLENDIQGWTAAFLAGAMTQEELDKEIEKTEEEFTPTYEFSYARVPMLSDDLKSRSLSVTDVLTVNGYSVHKKAANDFAAFVTTDYAKNIYPKTLKIAASTDANYEDETLLLFQDEYAASMPLTKIIEASNFWVQLEAAFTDVWRGGNVDEILKKLSEQMATQIMGVEHKDKKIDNDENIQ